MTSRLSSAADSMTRFLVVHSFLFYLDDIYPKNLFIACLVASVLLQFIKAIVFKLKKNKIKYTLLSIESFSYLLVGLKITSPSRFPSWAVVLVLYTFIFYVLIFAICLITFANIMMIVFYLTTDVNQHSMSKKNIFGVLVISVKVVCFLASLCLIYTSVRFLLEAGAVVPLASPTESIPHEMLVAGYLMIGLALTVLVDVLILNLFFKNGILSQFQTQPGKEVSMKVYTSAFTLRLQAISGKFFRKAKRDEVKDQTDLDTKDQHIMDECVICQTSQSCFLLQPCNHCLICSGCIQTFLESQSRCPLCKEVIKKCSHVAFSEERNRYLVDFAYKLKNL